MSDIWDDDSDYERNMAEKEWNRLQDQHGVIGYTEGVEEAKEKHLQKGFDQGYSIGSTIGLEVGKMQVKLDVLLSDLKSKSETKEIGKVEALLHKLKTLKFDQIFTKEWFRSLDQTPPEFQNIAKEYECISNKL
ncbi:hypothetical protein HDV01_004794 [Terramyces sp. JEL0728]|nr:hypothetical protein HDV01_004794 [Terramyces sp. JEL0728]